ncbi:MAG: DUF2294 domain-containing protein [Synechococcales bacterium]|nr:DUF2294 domain-containing protein [Synechococcales bacterium]
MDMPSGQVLPTRGQLERDLSQKVQALYRQQLNHKTGKVSCQIFDEKVAIVVENSITQPEKLLAEKGENELAEKVRSEIDEAIRQPLKDLLEDILGVKVLDLLSDAGLETDRTGIIAVLEQPPDVRLNGSKSTNHDNS